MIVLALVAAVLGCGGTVESTAAQEPTAVEETAAEETAAVEEPAPAQPHTTASGQRTYHLGNYLQCLALPAADDACRAMSDPMGRRCELLAMVPHPCAHQGSVCSEDQQASHQPEGV